jgi:hypothetical protein
MKITAKMIVRSIAAGLVMSMALGSVAIAGPIGLVDDFSGNLAAYTNTRILKATPANPDNVYSWEISGGALRVNTATFGGIEQYALTRGDYTLDVGQELQVDYVSTNTNTQDIGLYVGAATPTSGVRADYVNIYVRNNGQLFSRGFNGTTELSLSGGGTPVLDALFIKRNTASTFELGTYDGNVRTVLISRTMTNTSIGNVIGLYADIRQAGIRGSVDNLRIIPEPASLALLGMSMIGLLARRRA